MEPIFLEPVYKDYIWGGEKLKEVLHKDTPYEKTAESWEISTNKNGVNKIKQGEYKGKTLQEIFEAKENRIEIFGTKTKQMEKFPVLIKFIDATDKLSIQVHPDDEYAKQNEQDTGKTEMWYIMDCEEKAQIICGMKPEVKQEEIKDKIENKGIENDVQYINIKKGDSIYIPAGTIHAILQGSLICEIQQNSDITYRVSDWGRVGKDGKPRTLHIQQAKEVIKVDSPYKIQHTTNEIGEQNILTNSYFKINKIIVKDSYKDTTTVDTFFAYNVIEGKGFIKVKNKEYDLKLGDSFLLPANMGEYELKGEIQLLKTYL